MPSPLPLGLFQRLLFHDPKMGFQFLTHDDRNNSIRHEGVRLNDQLEIGPRLRPLSDRLKFPDPVIPLKVAAGEIRHETAVRQDRGRCHLLPFAGHQRMFDAKIDRRHAIPHEHLHHFHPHFKQLRPMLVIGQ